MTNIFQMGWFNHQLALVYLDVPAGKLDGIKGDRITGVVITPRNTPPKFNMEPENDGFQKESPFPGTSFQVPC